jgi:hypothetical protein
MKEATYGRKLFLLQIPRPLGYPGGFDNVEEINELCRLSSCSLSPSLRRLDHSWHTNERVQLIYPVEQKLRLSLQRSMSQIDLH